MIKVTDLMVGDWVQNPLDYKAQVLDIHYIEDEGDGYGGGYRIHIGKSNWECVQWLEEKDIKPIPLTPEILEKNGFYWGHTSDIEDFCGATGVGYPEPMWSFDEGAGSIQILFPNESDGGILILDDQDFDRHFEMVFCKTPFVHELQHALKLLGINKEIKL